MRTSQVGEDREINDWGDLDTDEGTHESGAVSSRAEGWWLAPGDICKGYTVVSPIGQGGYGQVYRVRARDGSEHALKMLQLNPAADRKVGRRLIQEAKIMAEVEHVNVVRFHHLSTSDDKTRLWLVMELLPGRTLRRLLQDQSEPLDPGRVLYIAEQAARGVDALHQVGAIHRDLKPENIMVLPGDMVKIIDFGIAKRYQSSLRTTRKNLLGTPLYMAPDHLSYAGDKADPRWDIFALGVVIWEMLLRRHPIENSDGDLPTAAGVITRQLYTRVPVLRDVSPHYPDFLSDLVARATEPDPAQRVSTMAELADLLGDARRSWRARFNPGPHMRPSDVDAMFRSGEVLASARKSAALETEADANEEEHQPRGTIPMVAPPSSAQMRGKGATQPLSRPRDIAETTAPASPLAMARPVDNRTAPLSPKARKALDDALSRGPSWIGKFMEPKPVETPLPGSATEQPTPPLQAAADPPTPMPELVENEGRPAVWVPIVAPPPTPMEAAPAPRRRPARGPARATPTWGPRGPALWVAVLGFAMGTALVLLTLGRAKLFGPRVRPTLAPLHLPTLALPTLPAELTPPAPSAAPAAVPATARDIAPPAPSSRPTSPPAAPPAAKPASKPASAAPTSQAKRPVPPDPF